MVFLRRPCWRHCRGGGQEENVDSLAGTKVEEGETGQEYCSKAGIMHLDEALKALNITFLLHIGLFWVKEEYFRGLPGLFCQNFHQTSPSGKVSNPTKSGPCYLVFFSNLESQKTAYNLLLSSSKLNKLLKSGLSTGCTLIGKLIFGVPWSQED